MYNVTGGSMKKFWREKNANYYIGKEDVIIPNIHELTDSIINKSEEKILMIDVIFDESARDKYLKEKNKVIPEVTPIIKIQQRIGARVIVDFLQLIKDYSLLKQIDLDKLRTLYCGKAMYSKNQNA